MWSMGAGLYIYVKKKSSCYIWVNVKIKVWIRWATYKSSRSNQITTEKKRDELFWDQQIIKEIMRSMYVCGDKSLGKVMISGKINKRFWVLQTLQQDEVSCEYVITQPKDNRHLDTRRVFGMICSERIEFVWYYYLGD